MIRLLLLTSAVSLPLAPASAQTATPPKAAQSASAATAKPTSVHHQHRHGQHKPPRRSTPSLSRVASANHAATHEPEATAFVNATQIYPFSEGSLYRIYASPERITDITLQPGEGLVAVAAGDTARWVIGDTTSGSGEAKRTHILVKPFSTALATNLVITTDRRTYHLSLTSTSGPAMAALSWTYPQDQLIALRREADAAERAAPVATGLAIEQLHFNYAISGDDPAWRPLRAFDDGRQTFIEFPASIGVGEAPPLFVLDTNGKAALVNYRMQGRFYVVDRIFDAAELRLGTKKQKIVRISRVAEGGHRGRTS
jgi:type IV secretion system protein VirB9